MADANRAAVRGMEVPINSCQWYNWLLQQADVPPVNLDTFTQNLNTAGALAALEHLQHLWDASGMRYPVAGVSSDQRVYEREASAIWSGNATIIQRLQGSNPDLFPKLGGWIAGRVDLVRRMMEAQPRVELWYGQFDHLISSVIPPPRNIAQSRIDTLIREVYNMRLAPKAALEQGQSTWQHLLNDWREELK